MQNLSELTRRLIAAQVEFVLVGGFAAVAHGVTRQRIVDRNHDRRTVHFLKEIKKQLKQK